jgi:hypothetical protein
VNKYWLKYIFLSVLVLIIVLSASCRPEPVAPDDARVIVLQPSADSEISSDIITVRTYVEYFRLVDKIGEPNVAGEGHLVFYRDFTPPVVSGTSALTPEGTFVISVEKTCAWKDVAPGKHSFWVQLVNNDNTSLEPPAAVRVPVTVIK